MQTNRKADPFGWQPQVEYADQNRTSLTVIKAPSEPMSLRVRVPAWASGDATRTLNGKTVAAEAKPGSYATVQRQWKSGDVLEVTIPMTVRIETSEPRREVTLRPFHELDYQRYTVYWQTVTGPR